jgi:RNA polymerase sigma factor (sigma-70 family)
MFEPLTDRERTLVETNVRLVHYAAQRYQSIPTEDYNDLILRLYQRLCYCVRAFKPELGNTFSTFAVKSLRNEAKNYFRDEMWRVRVSRKIREKGFAQMELDAMEKNEVGGENLDVIRSCATPLSFDLVPEKEQPGLEIEAEILARIGNNQCLRAIFSQLAEGERYVLALLMKGGSATHVQKRFRVSRSVATRICEEVRLRTRLLYMAEAFGEAAVPTRRTPTLCQLLRRRFSPPEEDYLSVRARIAEKQAA